MKNTENIENIKIIAIENTAAATAKVQTELETYLKTHFNHADDIINIINKSHQHRDHQTDFGGHYHLQIISHAFENLNMLARQKKVYSLLTGWINTRIHGIELQLQTPDELF